MPNYTKLMPENMVPGQKVKKVIFTGFSPPPIVYLSSQIKLGWVNLIFNLSSHQSTQKSIKSALLNLIRVVYPI